jgi:hypothetical protein
MEWRCELAAKPSGVGPCLVLDESGWRLKFRERIGLVLNLNLGLGKVRVEEYPFA